MPSLNEFHDKYSTRGARLLALSGEGGSVVEKFAEKAEIRYPLGIDSGSKTARQYGVTGLPKAFVIDPDGEIVWAGHPGAKSELEAAVESALERAAFIQLPDEPHVRLKKIVKLLAAQKLGDAHKAATTMLQDRDATVAEQAKEVVTRIDSLAQAQIERADTNIAQGAYFFASASLQRMAGNFKGTDHAKAMEGKVREIAGNPEAKDDLAAGAAYQKAMKYASVPDKFFSSLRKLIKKYPDTAVAAKARKTVG